MTRLLPVLLLLCAGCPGPRFIGDERLWPQYLPDAGYGVNAVMPNDGGPSFVGYFGRPSKAADR